MGLPPEDRAAQDAYRKKFANDVLTAMAEAFGAGPGGRLQGVFASGPNPYSQSYSSPSGTSVTGNMAQVGQGYKAVYGPAPDDGKKTGGGGYSAPASKALENSFIDWFGYVPKSLLATAKKQGWTEDNIRRKAVATKDAHGALLIRAQSQTRQIAALWYGGDPAAAPASLINAIIGDGIYADQDYLKNTYFPSLKGAGVDNPAAKQWVDYWTEQTGGRPPSGDALQKMSDIIKTYGFTQDSLNAWQNYVKTTDSAITGNYGAAVRKGINDDFRNILGREATDEELAANGDYWNESSDMRRERMKQTADYQSIYGGKPEWMTEENYLDYARALSSVYNLYYGPEISAEDEYDEEGNPLPHTGLDMFGIRNLDPAELSAAVASGYTPGDIGKLFEAHENAIGYEGQYGSTLLEAFGMGFTHEEWEAYSRGGAGAGALKVKLMEAQNRVSFREAFRDYNGRDPEPEDYDNIAANFVSPSEYAKRMSAKESAAEMLEEVNDVFQRVWGRGVTLDELENVAMGGKGSGEMKAKIAQAQKLDQYTEMYRQYYGQDPTPDDYASFIGQYRSAAEMQWELAVSEKMKEMGPDIQATWQKVYNTQLGDEELKAMLGEQEGYGDLRRQLKEAQEKVSKREASIRGAQSGEKIGTMYGQAAGGGFAEIGGIGDLGE